MGERGRERERKHEDEDKDEPKTEEKKGLSTEIQKIGSEVVWRDEE